MEKVGGELGLVLWKALRRVRMWAETAPDQRAGMFPPVSLEIQALMAAATVQGPELVEAIGVFAALLRAPERAEAKQVAEACNQVYQWADARGMSRVAMYFAEAAAAAEPTCPGWAIDSGWMCRRVAVDGMLERSAAWYDRAIGLAVRAEDRQEILRALTGYGALMKDMGRYDKARALYERAAQRAARTGRLRQAAVAQHYLLGLAAELGNYLQGERYARHALQNYPIHDPQLPALAHDWAFLLVRLCYYSDALSVAEVAVSRITSPEIQTVVWSTLARAAAGAGRRDRYEEAKHRVLQLVESYQEYAPAAFVNIAEGARMFLDWACAEQYARRALSLAQVRKDAEPERVAQQLVAKIDVREPAPQELASVDSARLEMLTRQFSSRLRKWKAPGQHQPGANPRTAEDQQRATPSCHRRS